MQQEDNVPSCRLLNTGHKAAGCAVTYNRHTRSKTTNAPSRRLLNTGQKPGFAAGTSKRLRTQQENEHASRRLFEHRAHAASCAAARHKRLRM